MNGLRTSAVLHVPRVALFVVPPPSFRRASCAACTRFVLMVDAKKHSLIRGLRDWRGGRVAEGGGLLNRYTV
jgi:hypothetical protein